MRDPIVEEVRRIREEHAAQFNYDIDAIFADIRKMAAESGEPRVSFGPKRIPRRAAARKRAPRARKTA